MGDADDTHPPKRSASAPNANRLMETPSLKEAVTIATHPCNCNGNICSR